MSANSVIRIAIWIIMLVGGGFFSIYLDSIFFDGIHKIIAFQILSFFAGIVLLLSLIRISQNTGRTLAKYGRKGNLKRMETNKLVTEEVYKYMRHPMHLGLLFFPLSVAFLIGSPAFILFVAPVEIIFMLIMIKYLEEPGAIKKFGDEYLEYKKQVPWFCFKRECLKMLFKKVSINKDIKL